jgi:hypothetical protein
MPKKLKKGKGARLLRQVLGGKSLTIRARGRICLGRWHVDSGSRKLDDELARGVRDGLEGGP